MLQKSLTLALFSLFAFITNAEELSQTIRGTIIDRDAKIAIIGANIIVLNSNPIKGATTDVSGKFRIESVTVGRVSLQISYIGYKPKIISNILLSSSKELILDIELEESIHSLEEIKVNGQRKKGEALNEMALMNARSFTVEETKRYAGSVNDPSRMVSSFAGVTVNPDGNNDIVVRGNSPQGILWRLEGVEIPNPNHFSNEGMTGGPINILSSEMLTNSDFYTGAFAPEYGNALSGVFDMKMKSGNNEKRECSVGLGVLGTDLVAEGPIKKGYGGSYIANYRYSSLAMLDDAGIVDFNGVPKYQDASFKVFLPTKKIGSFSLFGVGGISTISGSNEDENEVVRNKEEYSAYMGVVGLNHMYQLNNTSFLKNSISLSGNGSQYDEDELNTQTQSFYQDGYGHWDKTVIKISSQYSNKLSAKDRLLVGISLSNINYDMESHNYNMERDQMEQRISLNKNSQLIQAHTTWKHHFTDELTFVGGVHSMNYTLTNDLVVEPRLALKWQLNSKQNLSLGYGIHSNIGSIISYYTILTDELGNESTPNRNLEMPKANHYTIGYEYRLTANLIAKAELYYQDLYNIPIEDEPGSNFSIINSDNGYIHKALVNKGTGKNFGLDLTLERFFTNNYYFLITGSLYDSKYKAMDNIERNTKYNGNYSLNILAGKEFVFNGEKGKNLLNINSKLYLNGGRRYIPLNLAQSIAEDDDVYFEDQAYRNKIEDVWQINFAASYKMNRKKVSHEIVLDIMNLTNNQSRIDEYYDSYSQTKDYSTQLGILPNIMYRIHF